MPNIFQFQDWQSVWMIKLQFLVFLNFYHYYYLIFLGAEKQSQQYQVNYYFKNEQTIDLIKQSMICGIWLLFNLHLYFLFQQLLVQKQKPGFWNKSEIITKKGWHRNIISIAINLEYFFMCDYYLLGLEINQCMNDIEPCVK